MIIRIASLHLGTNTVEESIDPAGIGLDKSTFSHPVEVTGEIENIGGMLDVQLHLSTEGDFICDRCAVEFARSFEVDMRSLVMMRDPHSLEERETEGLIFIGEKGVEADLSQEILDALYLDIPMVVHCRPGCRGLCPRCGADLNEGPCGCDA